MTDPGNAALRLRDARPDELDEVARLLLAAYGQYETLIRPGAWEPYRREISDVRGRLAVAALIVAELDSRLVGTVSLYLPPAPHWPDGWAGIRLLGVDPACRRRGIARALIDECVRRCRERGIAAIGLHTAEIMDAARLMYEGMGFERVPDFDFHPAPGVVVKAYRLEI